MRFDKPRLCQDIAGVSLVVWLMTSGLAFAEETGPAVPRGPEAPAPDVQSTETPKAKETKKERLIALDFNNVDLPVFVKFISELTGKNFIIDERVRGKVTIFSPNKVTLDKTYQIFLSILELKGLMAVPIGEAIQILPRGEVPTERTLYVYTVQNMLAEEMKGLIGGFIRGPTGVRPALLPATDFEGPVQVLIADKVSNMLAILASPRDYEMVETFMKKFDVKKKQVYVEAVLLEVGMEKARSLGVDIGGAFLYQGGDLAVIGGVNAAPEDLARSVGPLAQAVPGGVRVGAINVKALLKALQTSADVNILSTPQLLTVDQQRAEIIVGENRPFPTGQTVTTGGVVQTTIERRDVGITLRFTPQILENDQVRMEIYQEISAVNEGVGSSVGTVVVGPTTTKRAATTMVIIQDQQTVVIAGLIKDDLVKSEQKVPLLGDIPLLGWFFKTQSRKVEKRNLLVFLTPTIVKDPMALAELKREKSRQVLDFMEKHKTEDRESRRPFLETPVNPPMPQEAPVTPPKPEQAPVNPPVPQQEP